MYFDPYPNKFLDKYIPDFNKVQQNAAEELISLKKLDSVEDVLNELDVSCCHVTAAIALPFHTHTACLQLLATCCMRLHACAYSPDMANRPCTEEQSRKM